MRGGFDTAIGCGRQDYLHGAKRASDGAGFTANTLCLIDLDGVIDLTNGAIRAAAGAGGVLTMMAGRSATLLIHFDDRDARQKLRDVEHMLLIVMRHHTGHFTCSTSNTFLAIHPNKTVHTLSAYGYKTLYL